MILSTSTNIYCERPGGTVIPIQNTLESVANAGFRTFDMSFYEYSYPGSLFLTDEWEKWVAGIKDTAKRLGVNFYQCHGYTYDFLNPAFSDVSAKERQGMLVRRSIDCCATLGAKVLVMHAYDGNHNTYTKQDVWERNKEYLEEVALYAESKGMILAVENRYDTSMPLEETFFVRPEEVVDFIDHMGSGNVGVCWDFEHSAIMDMNQTDIVRILGSRLIATHVSDTVSKDFEPYMHVMPFTGMTDWHSIMKALKDVSYEGAFSFEAHNFIKKLPDELVPTALRFSYEIGQYLLSI